MSNRIKQAIALLKKIGHLTDMGGGHFGDCPGCAARTAIAILKGD